MKKLMLVVMLIMSLTLVACQGDGGEATPQFVWSGLEEQIVTRGDAVDLLKDIEVMDKEEGSLTSSIEVLDDDGFSTHLAGGYNVKYKIVNSKNKEDIQSKQFIVRVGHNVANGNFELNKFGWTLDHPGGNAEMNVVNQDLVVDIASSGTAWWAIQIKQEGVVFSSGKVYKMSIVASSAQGHSIAGGYEDPNNGFRMLNPGFQAMALTATPQTYEMYYRAAESFSNVKVVIYLGHMLRNDLVQGDEHQVVIDSIKIEEVKVNNTVSFEGYEPRVSAQSGALADISPRDGLVVKHDGSVVTESVEIFGNVPDEILADGSYYITYVYKHADESISYAIRRFDMKLSKDNPYQVVNGDFSKGFTGWIQDVNQTNGTGAAVFTDNGDGTVSITVENVSNAGWHIQLQQAGATLTEGNIYTVKLVIKSSETRNIDIEVVDPSNGFAQITPTLQAASVGTEWTTFELEFTALANFSNAKIAVLLGNVDGLQVNNVTVTVDEFQIYEANQD